MFITDIRFLGHRISANGVEADEGKMNRVRDWPIPTSAKQVRGFLGLVRYLSNFLPDLATHTRVLDELTTKDCNKRFPHWADSHQHAFDNIKSLAMVLAAVESAKTGKKVPVMW